MTDRERIQHNARVIRARVHGKTESERRQLYVALRIGLFAWPIVVILQGLENTRHQQNEEKLAAGDLG